MKWREFGRAKEEMGFFLEMMVKIAEEGGRVVFLRRIIPGGADRSYGIHVAQLAGLPKSVLHRAQEVLSELEEDSNKKSVPRTPGARRSPRQTLSGQLSLFAGKSPVLEELEKLDIDSMSPLDAITKLYEQRKKAMEESK